VTTIRRKFKTDKIQGQKCWVSNEDREKKKKKKRLKGRGGMRKQRGVFPAESVKKGKKQRER